MLHELAQDRVSAEKAIYEYMQQQAILRLIRITYLETQRFGKDYKKVKAGQGDMGAVAMTSMEGTQMVCYSWWRSYDYG